MSVNLKKKKMIVLVYFLYVLKSFGVIRYLYLVFKKVEFFINNRKIMYWIDYDLLWYGVVG